MNGKRERAWLIIRADRTMRVVRRWPNLRGDEVAVRLEVTFPAGWGSILAAPPLEITVPDFVPAVEVAP